MTDGNNESTTETNPESPAEGAPQDPLESAEAAPEGEVEEEGDPSHEGEGDGEGDPPEPESAAHPANPAVVPIQPKPKLTEFVPLTVEEIAEKGKSLAKEYVEIEALKKKRAQLGAQIKEKEEVIGGLVVAITTGQVEVPVEQQDLLRQPVGAQEAARAFEKMAEDAKAAGQETPAEPSPEAQAAEAELNAMAADIQAEQGITEPGPGFLNDIENHKSKMAAKRKGA